MRNRSPTRKAWPCGFFWLPTQDPLWLIALTTRGLVERGMDRRRALGLVGCCLVVGFADHGRPQSDHCAGGVVHQDDVLVRRRCLLAAVMCLVLGGVGRALAAPLGAVNGHIGPALPCQRAVGDPARVALRYLSPIPQGVLPHRPQTMPPGVGWRLTHVALPPGQRLQGMRLLRDQHEQKRVGHARLLPLCASACPPLAGLTITGAIRWILCVVGGLERGP